MNYTPKVRIQATVNEKILNEIKKLQKEFDLRCFSHAVELLLRAGIGEIDLNEKRAKKELKKLWKEIKASI